VSTPTPTLTVGEVVSWTYPVTRGSYHGRIERVMSGDCYGVRVIGFPQGPEHTKPGERAIIERAWITTPSADDAVIHKDGLVAMRP